MASTRLLSQGPLLRTHSLLSLFAGEFRLCAGSRLQLPACRWAWGRHVDSISQPAPGLGPDVPAPIRPWALRPKPIVSRSRGGSGRLLPGTPELPAPPALRRLPADLPTHRLSPPCRLGNSQTVFAAPGLALSSLLPTRARAATAAAAGAAETITGGGSCGGAGNGPGGAGRRVPPCPFSGSASRQLWRSGQPRAAGMEGSEMREPRTGAVGGGGGELGRRWEGKESGEAWERGARRTRARTAGAAWVRPTGGLRSRQEFGCGLSSEWSGDDVRWREVKEGEGGNRGKCGRSGWEFVSSRQEGMGNRVGAADDWNEREG